MKTLLATAVLAAAVGPALALADTTATAAPPAPPSAAQMQSRMAEFRQVHQRMEQLHTQARLEMLNSISPAHKTALANLLGQLAISEKPDIEATARQINSLLSPSEAQSVVRIHDALRSQMTALMEQVHSQMQRQAPPGAQHPAFKPMEQSNRPVDAGHIVLRLIVPSPGLHEAMMAPHPM